MQGRLILVHLMCRDIATTPQSIDTIINIENDLTGKLLSKWLSMLWYVHSIINLKFVWCRYIFPMSGANMRTRIKSVLWNPSVSFQAINRLFNSFDYCTGLSQRRRKTRKTIKLIWCENLNESYKLKSSNGVQTFFKVIVCFCMKIEETWNVLARHSGVSTHTTIDTHT